MKTLQFAIQMERDGEKYYLEQANENAGSKLARVFQVLAGAERKHAELIERCAAGSEMDYKSPELAPVANVFSDLSDFKPEVASVPRQLDVYSFAMDLEQKSITLYQDLLAKADDKKEQELLRFLVEQEQAHYDLFEQLTTLLQRPEDWVEDAEFGRREEY